MDGRCAFVTEIEWWDRVAMALDRLSLRSDARRRDVKALLPAGVEAYVYEEVRDVETLRRITQMPDETPSDLLILPFSLYCLEMNSFVSINDPDTSVGEHLRRLQGGVA